MRIIAGKFGGRTYDSPHGKRTHPMSDKARGALFNMLGDIEGLTLLDAFAGSGALAYEAISRGGASVTAIEIDPKAQKTIEHNIKTLDLRPHIKLIRANCSAWSATNPDAQFDIVIAAPPYDDLQQSVVQKIVKHTKPDGLFVLDWPGKMVAPNLDGLELVTAKTYGDAQLAFYRPKHI